MIAARSPKPSLSRACASLRELYGHLRPQRPFVAATWDAIHALIPAWALSLLCPSPIPRPNHDAPPAPLPAPDWTAPDPALPARLQWQIRDTEIPTAERVLLLCRHAPQDWASLERMLPDTDRVYLRKILPDYQIKLAGEVVGVTLFATPILTR